MQLSALYEKIQGRMVGEREKGADAEVCALSTDSREQTKDGVFFCLVGSNVDAHTKAQETVKNGAIAVVCERQLEISAPQIIVEDTRVALAQASSVFYGEPCKALKIIAVTGTNGKTTTSYMLASILRNAGKKVGVIGTLGIRYDGREELSALTTPDPVVLHETLAKMRDCGVEYVVLEVSAHALYYKKIYGLTFVAVIFTNFTQDHLDFFGTMQAYEDAKLRLFLEYRCPLAVVNGDDETGRKIARLREREGNSTLVYGLNTPADAFALVTDEGLRGSECMLNVTDRLCRVTLAMAGRHNVYNALAAATCASALGVSTAAIAKGLTTLRGVDGRLEWVGEHRGANVYVDFAHTSDGLEKALETLRPHCKGRLLCLFGCGGNRDKSKRPIMGETAARKADFCILTSDNPRYEDPLDVISDVERGYRRLSSRYVVVPDRATAIDYALDFSKEEDVLLVAGKGGETYQEIMGIKYPFNDKAIIVNLIRKKEKEST